MQKQITTQPQIKLIGISIRTNNLDELDPATRKIGALVSQYFQNQTAAKIPNRKNPGVTYVVYTEYASDEFGDYTYYIGEEVSSVDDIPEGLVSTVIPSGKYVKFTTAAGKLPSVVINAWMDIWQMSNSELGGERNYQADFEIYDERAADLGNAVVDICVGIKI